MVLEFIQFLSFVSVMALAVVAGVSDFLSLRIPNWISLAVVGLFLVFHFAGGASFMALLSPVVVAGVMFLVTFVMFAVRMIGAGDSKFATALALWVGGAGLVPYIFFMSFFGGVLAVVGLCLRRMTFSKTTLFNPQGGWIEALQGGRNALPYGIAISAGFFVALFLSPIGKKQFSFIYQLFL